jgi:uncharacterized protein YerC
LTLPQHAPSPQKGAETMSAIRQIQQNSHMATVNDVIGEPRKLEILNYLAAGMTYRQIAKKMGIALGTISKEVNEALTAYRATTLALVDDLVTEQDAVLRQALEDLQGDLYMQATPELDKSGKPVPGHWSITPGHAAKIRNMARTQQLKVLEALRNLHGLDKPKIEKKQVAVMVIKNVDMDAL